MLTLTVRQVLTLTVRQVLTLTVRQVLTLTGWQVLTLTAGPLRWAWPHPAPVARRPRNGAALASVTPAGWAAA